MTDLTGNFLGPYRILEQIGHGGMATIYKAYQPAMDRLVAIKVLHPHSSRDQHVAERFEHEVLVIAGLEHRHIIPVYDFGRQGELLYLIMRYVRAGTVSDLIKRGPLHLVDAASLLSDIASALDYAHHLNIIHRDIKPNNILVDAEGRAYLTDFGLAKVMDENLELTLTGAAIGTPAYMAPEQVAGQKVTPRTDIYAMGVMLYEMLTGQLPYQSESPMALAMMHLRDPLRPPQQINPTIPVAVELVIKRAMSKNAADRYWTAGDMARDLAGAAAIHADNAHAGSRLLDDQRWSGNIESPADNLVNNADRATLNFNTKPHLAQMANEIALAKSPDKITPQVRREIQNLERETRRQTVLARAPWITAGLLIIVLLVSLSFTISGLAQSRISADETATAVQLLLFQLSDAQTSIAKGDPGSQATLAYLQTQLASISITGTPPPTQPTSTLMTTTATPSATRPPATYTQEAGGPGTDFITTAGAPTAQPNLVPTQPAPSAVGTSPPSTAESTLRDTLPDAVSDLPDVAGPPDEKLEDPKPDKDPKPTKVK